MFLRESARTAAKPKRRTNLRLSTNSGKATKPLKTAGPYGTKFGTNVQINLGTWINTPNKLPLGLETQGGTSPLRTCGVLGGQTFKSRGSCQTAGPIGTNFDKPSLDSVTDSLCDSVSVPVGVAVTVSV